MRLLPIPPDVPGTRVTLAAPDGVAGGDVQPVEVLAHHVQLPSGLIKPAVSGLVWASAAELRAIKKAGGCFWFRVLGKTFPPVVFETVTG